MDSRGPYKNGENFVLSQNVLRKYFLAKFFVPFTQRSVSTKFKTVFGKWNFFRKINSRAGIFFGKSTAAPLTKMVEILYYLEMCQENFLAKCFVPLNKRSVSTTF